MLHEVNVYVRDLKTTLNKVQDSSSTFKVVIRADKKPAEGHQGRFNAPTADEVALVMVGEQFSHRDIILESHDSKLRRISELHRSYDALQYPLLFPYGEDGYSIDIPQRTGNGGQPVKKTVSAASFYTYRIMCRESEDNHLLRFNALLSQYLLDMFAKIQAERLNFIRNNQAALRADSYIHLRDAVSNGDVNPDQVGQKVILPSTFNGGPQYMHERTQDALTFDITAARIFSLLSPATRIGTTSRLNYSRNS